MEEGSRKRVLVCPLGWGLGHASRLIPIIARFQKEGFEVIAAGDDLQMKFISSFYPQIKRTNFPSIKVTLTKGSNQFLPILGIVLRLPYHIIKEHFGLRRIVREHNIDLIISDNRYGLWHKGIKSVLITHQQRVLFPKPFMFLEPVGMCFIRQISKKFTYCWIPDYSDEKNLAGKLSHPAKIPDNAWYIGIQSRFQGLRVEVRSQEWGLVGIASGPSPQREIFINLLAKLSKRNNLKTLIIKGNPIEGTKIYNDNGIFYAGHLEDIDFATAILSSKYIITRAGYSTIMDLSALGISGLIVPTSGQTEQEYLADYLSKKGLFKTCKQGDLVHIDISNALSIRKETKIPCDLFEKVFQEFSSTIDLG